MTGTPSWTVTAQVPTEREVLALVTIETAERLAVKAHQSILAGDITEALRLLVSLTYVTTQRTGTAVKDQSLSDTISRDASARVTQVLARKPVAAPGSGGE